MVKVYKYTQMKAVIVIKSTQVALNVISNGVEIFNMKINVA